VRGFAGLCGSKPIFHLSRHDADVYPAVAVTNVVESAVPCLTKSSLGKGAQMTNSSWLARMIFTIAGLLAGDCSAVACTLAQRRIIRGLVGDVFRRLTMR